MLRKLVVLCGLMAATCLVSLDAKPVEAGWRGGWRGGYNAGYYGGYRRPYVGGYRYYGGWRRPYYGGYGYSYGYAPYGYYYY